MRALTGLSQIVALALVVVSIILILFGVTTVATLIAWVALGMFTFNTIIYIGMTSGARAVTKERDS